LRTLVGWALSASSINLALGGGVSLFARDSAPLACSIAVPPPWTRSDTLSYLVLRARPDSIPATMWRPPVARLGLPRDAPDPPPAPERIVYGQHVEILRAVGPAADALRALGRADSVALVAWRTTSSCSWVPPHPILILSEGDEAFLAAVPRRDRRGRFQTLMLDLWPSYRFYDPVLEREYYPREGKRLWLAPGIMSVAEFEVFYNALPPESLWKADPARALTHLEEWAGSYPELARREPARRILKEARLAKWELRDQAHNERP
jgi:hypothetical protein